MRNILENYSPDNNFWDYNPQFRIVEPFISLYKSDKSRGKKVSSNLMWAFAHIHHPKSDLYDFPNKEQEVAKSYLKDEKFDFDKYKDHMEIFADMCLTQAEKSLVAWDKRMRSRDRFLDGQEYSFGEEYIDNEGNAKVIKGNAKELDEMNARTAKIYQEYFKIKQDIEKDDTIQASKRPTSLSDTGEM